MSNACACLNENNREIVPSHDTICLEVYCVIGN